MRVTRHMSRHVTVQYSDGREQYHYLSIATVTEVNGIVTHVEVKPFSEECQGVIYHDTPIIITHGAPLKI